MSASFLPELTFVSSKKLLYLEDVSALAQYVWSGAWQEKPHPAYVVFRPDTGGHYVFGGVRFRELALAARQCLFRAFDLEALCDLFHIHEGTASAISYGGPPAEAAGVAFDNDRSFAGAWVNVDEVKEVPKRRSARPEVPEISFERPNLASRRSSGFESLEPELPQALDREMELELPEPTDGEVALESFGIRAPEPSSLVQEFRRTPHLQPAGPAPLTPGSAFTVEVYADELAPQAGERTQQVVIAAPASTTEFALRVHLATSEHLSVRLPEGAVSADQDLVLRRSESASPRLLFSIAVAPTAPVGAAGTVTALFSYQGRPCGQVSREFVVGGQPGTQPAGGVLAQPVPATSTAAPSVIALTAEAQPADLIITVVNPSRDRKTFTCCIQSALLPEFAAGVWKDWLLPDVTDKVVQGYFGQFTAEQSKPARLAALRGAGKSLFRSSPAHFQEVFWKLVEGRQPFRSILIVSEEPYIPWELMIPSRLVQGEPHTRQALGVEFLMGRWIRDDTTSPRQRLPLTDSRVFAPNYRGPRPTKLLNAAAEAEFVVQNFQGKLISPAAFAGIEHAMEEGGASLLHFICHGAESTPVAQQIYLEDNTVFTSVQVGGIEALEAACRKRNPLVFLNACEVGRAQPALVGIGGFAQAFIQVGAKAIVAPLWSVSDEVAHDIALEFYQTVQSEPETPYAEVLRRIRAKAYLGATGGEDTYAAYCFYGDPLARNEAAT